MSASPKTEEQVIISSKKYCRVLSAEQLSKMHTGSLMKPRSTMLSIELRRDLSDCSPEELALFDRREEIFWKEDPRWQPQYDALKAVLDTREHWPSGRERRQLRRERIKARSRKPKRLSSDG